MSNKLTIKSSTGVSIPTILQLPLPTVDEQAYGDIVTFGTSGALTPGLVYGYTSDGEWNKAQADAEEKAKVLLGIALGDSSSKGMLLRGLAKFNTYYTFTTGDVLYLEPVTSFGLMTPTIPSTSNEIIRILGYYIDNNTVYFNPDPTYTIVP